MEQEKVRPVKVIRYGGVKATVWRNQLESGFIYNTVFTRSYKDKDGKWQETAQFRPNDLHKIQTAAQKVYEFILDKDYEGEQKTAA